MKDLNWDFAIRGLLDGTLATLGVVIGARGADPSIIIAAGISGGVANSLSNILAAFSAQKAIMLNELRQVEDAMVAKDLEGTKTHQEREQTVRVKSLMDGAATVFGALVPVLPYFFFPADLAMYSAVGVTSFLGFLIGVVMGKLSRQHVIYLGLKMAFIAIVVAAASALLQNGLNTLLK